MWDQAESLRYLELVESQLQRKAVYAAARFGVRSEHDEVRQRASVALWMSIGKGNVPFRAPNRAEDVCALDYVVGRACRKAARQVRQERHALELTPELEARIARSEHVSRVSHGEFTELNDEAEDLLAAIRRSGTGRGEFNRVCFAARCDRKDGIDAEHTCRALGIDRESYCSGLERMTTMNPSTVDRKALRGKERIEEITRDANPRSPLWARFKQLGIGLAVLGAALIWWMAGWSPRTTLATAVPSGAQRHSERVAKVHSSGCAAGVELAMVHSSGLCRGEQLAMVHSSGLCRGEQLAMVHSSGCAAGVELAMVHSSGGRWVPDPPAPSACPS